MSRFLRDIALKFPFLSSSVVYIYMCIYIFTTWLTFNPPPPPPLTAWRIRERNGASPVSKSEANGEKISIFYEGDNTPVPECSPFYCPGMKQRWRRCDFWGNVVLWFPSRNFILALQPLSSITASLLLAGLPTWSPQYVYFSYVVIPTERDE